jgi:hypothetical protein
MKPATSIFKTALAFLAFFALIACSNSSGGGGGGANPGAGGGTPPPAEGGGNGNTGAGTGGGAGVGGIGDFRSDKTSGGCRVRLVSPTHGQELDLRQGKSASLEWTTDGTTCETPWKLHVAGVPFSQDRTAILSINTNGGTITQKGGILPFNAQDLAGLPGDNGVYHWTIESFHGSAPASISFRVIK